MSRGLGAALALGALAVMEAVPARAAIAYDNGAPDQVSGTNMSEQAVAEDFTLAASSRLLGIRFWAILDAPASYRGEVYWAIHSNASGEPGSLLSGGSAVAVPAVATGASTAFGYAAYSFDVPIDTELDAGTYWLVLHNGDLGENGPAEMLWSTTGAKQVTQAKYDDENAGWVGAGTLLAFRIEDSVIFVDGFEIGNTSAWDFTTP